MQGMMASANITIKMFTGPSERRERKKAFAALAVVASNHPAS
jgi:hypothetical protein